MEKCVWMSKNRWEGVVNGIFAAYDKLEEEYGFLAYDAASGHKIREQLVGYAVGYNTIVDQAGLDYQMFQFTVPGHNTVKLVLSEDVYVVLEVTDEAHFPLTKTQLEQMLDSLDSGGLFHLFGGMEIVQLDGELIQSYINLIETGNLEGDTTELIDGEDDG